jgi:hypothetical protein
LQEIWHQFEMDREHAPCGTREAVEWAVVAGLLELPILDPYDVLASQMASALREEIRTDSKGRRYRVNHAMRITKGGVQHTLWGVMGYTKHEHMANAFAQRREQIIGDCFQLKTDVDHYNDIRAKDDPSIQLVLDFTDDVAEREITKAA